MVKHTGVDVGRCDMDSDIKLARTVLDSAATMSLCPFSFFTVDTSQPYEWTSFPDIPSLVPPCKR
jgi:hypothetical protein